MFASLRNKFLNYRSCSLRFDIEGNIIIEDFASLRFDNLVICLWCLYYRGLCCSWRCLHYRGLSSIWTSLHCRGVYCSWRCLPQNRARAACGRVCTAEECTAPGGVCHRAWAASGRVCTTKECTAPGGVCHRAWAASGMCCFWRTLPKTFVWISSKNSVHFINEDQRTGHNNDNSLDSLQCTTKTIRKVTRNFARFYNCHVNGINVLKKSMILPTLLTLSETLIQQKAWELEMLLEQQSLLKFGNSLYSRTLLTSGGEGFLYQVGTF